MLNKDSDPKVVSRLKFGGESLVKSSPCVWNIQDNRQNATRIAKFRGSASQNQAYRRIVVLLCLWYRGQRLLKLVARVGGAQQHVDTGYYEQREHRADGQAGRDYEADGETRGGT